MKNKVLISLFLLSLNTHADFFRIPTQLFSATINDSKYHFGKPIEIGKKYKVLKKDIISGDTVWSMIKVKSKPKTIPKIGFMPVMTLKRFKAQQIVHTIIDDIESSCSLESRRLLDSLNFRKRGTDVPITENISPECFFEKIKETKEIKELQEEKFHKGCEVLADTITDDSEDNINALKLCIENLIQTGMKGALVKGSKFEIKNKEGQVIRSYPAVNPKIFFQNIYKNLNISEKNFLGRILTSIGESGNIALERRSFNSGPRPYYQEMMAINMILENRLSYVKGLNDKYKENKEKAFKLYDGLSENKIKVELGNDIKGINRLIYHAKDKKAYLRKIRSEFSDMLNGVDKYNPKYENLTTLDMAIENDGYSFSMYKGINKNIRRYRNYKYRGWYKVISKDAQQFYDVATKSYIMFNKVMQDEDYPKDVTHYYSTSIKKPTFAKVIESMHRYPKLEHIAFNIDGETLYTKTHKIYSSRRGSRYPYTCNQKLTSKQRLSKSRTGHCFYSNIAWRYIGHKF